MNKLLSILALALCLSACGSQPHTANDAKPCDPKKGDGYDKAGETIGSAIATSSRWSVTEAKDLYDYISSETNKERAEFVWAAFTHSLSSGLDAALEAAKKEYTDYQKTHKDTK